MYMYVNGVFSLADVKYEVLSLSCRKGDLECVKMMINKYDCDPKGFVIYANCLCCVRLWNVNMMSTWPLMNTCMLSR